MLVIGFGALDVVAWCRFSNKSSLFAIVVVTTERPDGEKKALLTDLPQL